MAVVEVDTVRGTPVSAPRHWFNKNGVARFNSQTSTQPGSIPNTVAVNTIAAVLIKRAFML